jgi:signal transduction histidine kinase
MSEPETQPDAGSGKEQAPISPDELATLFLFEALDRDKLEWLAEHGGVESRAAGSIVCAQGEPATCFYVLLSGTVALSRRVQQDEVEINRTDQRGVYAGATQAYLGDRTAQIYSSTMRAVTECRFFVLPAESFATIMRTWFPMAMHLLEGLFFGMRASEASVGQRERLVALGALSAGLTHELNNPASAAVRATALLRERVAGMRHKIAMLARGDIDTRHMRLLTELQERAVERAATAPELTPVETGDREDELGDWLEGHGVTDGWDLAPVLVAAGLDVEWAERVKDTCGGEHLDGALRWLTYTVETEQLMTEIEDAAKRISTLVSAAKQYSQMDRAPHQWVDVHDGLKSTLVMLGRKIGDGVRVVKDFDLSLPKIPAYPGELNQVWTNLIDNAVSAMQGTGTLTVRTRPDGDSVLVEIGDTGPGVPDDLRRRIFEPFFTTKPVGEGTGLGLDISWRIVVNRHGGDLRVESQPGDTRFQVRLPLQEPSSM